MFNHEQFLFEYQSNVTVIQRQLDTGPAEVVKQIFKKFQIDIILCHANCGNTCNILVWNGSRVA
jgi:hypothetical protein